MSSPNDAGAGTDTGAEHRAAMTRALRSALAIADALDDPLLAAHIAMAIDVAEREPSGGGAP